MGRSEVAGGGHGARNEQPGGGARRVFPASVRIGRKAHAERHAGELRGRARA